MNDNATPYQQFLTEQDALIQKNNHLMRLLPIINDKLRIHFEKNQTEFFSIQKLFQDIPEIPKYFKLQIYLGDRNLGKTTSLLNFLADEYVKNQDCFVWVRALVKETEKTQTSDFARLWSKRGYFTSKKDGYISVDRFHHEQVGYYTALSTVYSAKSVAYDKVKYMVFDEFIQRDSKIKEKFNKLINYTITVERFKPNFKMFLLANYDDVDDEILLYLNFGKSVSKNNEWMRRKFCMINPLGFLLIKIPKGYFLRASKLSTTLGYALSLSNFSVWRQMYGGDFLKNEYDSIITYTSILTKVFMCKITHRSIEYNLFKSQIANQTEFVIVAIENSVHRVENANHYHYVFDIKHLLRHYHTNLIQAHLVKNLLWFHMRGRLKFTNIVPFENFIDGLSNFINKDNN